MTSWIARLAVALGLCIALSRTARAADWYVDASAASGGDGSMAMPFQTINAVLAGLQQGDTVWLASGTYNETVNFWMLPGSGTTTVRALPGATPVIDGTNGSQSAGFILQAGTPNMVFQGLTLQNSAADGFEIYQSDGCQIVDSTTTGITGNAVTFYYANQGLVSDCKLQGGVGGRRSTGTIVQNSELYGSMNHEGITIYDDSTNCQYLHNVIHDNYSVNLYLDSISHSIIDGNLIYESTPGNNNLVGLEISDETYSDLPAPVNSYNTIINNVIVGNEWGIQFWSGDFPPGTSGLKYDVISNNTLVNNLGAVKWDAGDHVGTTLENNIVVVASTMTPSYLLQANSTTGITLDHNLWYAPSLAQAFQWGSGADAVDHAGWVTASGQGAGDVLLDPAFAGMWTAPPATNLELTAGSPAIGTGIPLAAVKDDFLGAARPANGGFDIGAFQYGAVVTDGGVGPTPQGDAGIMSGGDGGGGGGVGDGGGGSGPSNNGAPGGGSSSSGCACASTVSTLTSTSTSTSDPRITIGLGLLGVALLRRRRR
jgi:uncharacterized protein (TIGR03382 family)